MDTLWVFGYGSLIWDPGFTVSEQEIARLEGFHRSFCMWSIHHRGTENDPGLVLALDAAETFCDGVAFRAAEPEAALEYLRERELVSSAYLEEWHDITLRDGRRVSAVCYVINRDHVQYCGDLSLERQAQVIARAVGGRGPNTEYLFNTAKHINDLGLPDADLDWLYGRVKTLTSG